MTKPSLTGIGIAITRPIDQAKKLSALITQAGGMPILFPLIEITPLNDYGQFDAVINDIKDYDWAIFISSNAVQNGMPRLLKQGIPPNLKFAAIGPVTASELQSFGVKDVLTPLSHVQDGDESKVRFDSESLLALPEMTNVFSKKILIIRGVGGRDVLAETLKARGAQVTFAECYQRINPQTNCDLLAQLWAEKKLHGIVVTSSEAMRHLLDLADNSEWLKNVILFVNHARIAELPSKKGFKVIVADELGDDAMLEKLFNNSALIKGFASTSLFLTSILFGVFETFLTLIIINPDIKHYTFDSTMILYIWLLGLILSSHQIASSLQTKKIGWFVGVTSVFFTYILCILVILLLGQFINTTHYGSTSTNFLLTMFVLIKNGIFIFIGAGISGWLSDLCVKYLPILKTH